MSRRRQSYQGHTPVSPDDLLAAMYGEKQARDVADLTIVPERITPDPWLDGIQAAVRAILAALLVLVAWNVGARLLGVLP